MKQKNLFVHEPMRFWLIVDISVGIAIHSKDIVKEVFRYSAPSFGKINKRTNTAYLLPSRLYFGVSIETVEDTYGLWIMTIRTILKETKVITKQICPSHRGFSKYRTQELCCIFLAEPAKSWYKWLTVTYHN